MYLPDNNHLVPFAKTAVAAGFFALFFLAGASAQAAPQISVKNETHASYSAGSAFATSVRAEPGDMLVFQMFGNFISASRFIMVLPSDLAYSANTDGLTIAPAASTGISGQTITWDFTTTSTQVIQFRAIVASGAVLSANHTLSVSFDTDTAAPSNSVTITTGPIVTGVAPNFGNTTNAVPITITGFGLTGATAVALWDGTNSTSLNLSGATITDTSISGANFKVPALQPGGSYWILVTVTAGGNALTTNADSTETVAYTVDTVPPSVVSFAVDQNGNTSGNIKAGPVVVSAVFDESIGIAPSITIDQPGSADSTSQTMTLTSSNRYAYTYTVQSDNGGDYIDGTAVVTISLAADSVGNVMNSSNFEFVIDTVIATPAITDLAAAVVDNSTITLSFTPGALEPDFGQFKVYYDFFSGVNSENGTMASSSVPLFQVAELSAGRTYYFAVYACDTADNCSEASNEASARVFSYAVSLSKGWNLVSFPVDPMVGGAVAAISDVFASVPSVSAVWSYRSQNGEWLAYWPSNPDQSTLSAVEAGYGYWVQYTDDVPLVFFGYGELFLEGPNAPPSAELSAGWNLIGYYQLQDTTSVPVSYALRNNLYNLSTLNPLWSQLLKYDTLANNFIELNATSLMDPGTGYWILMSGNGESGYIYTLGATP